MQLSLLASLAALAAMASAEPEAGVTSAKLSPDHSPLLFARQSDSCVSQYGNGWQSCDGSGLCYDAQAGAVCCTDDTQNYVCPTPGAVCAGNGLCNNPSSSSSKSSDGVRPVIGLSLGLVGVGMGFAAVL